jgi:hypothetical protein
MNIKHMYRLKNTVIVLFLIILVNGSCRNIFRKDHSLTLKEYQAKGMPEINIVWPQSKLMEAYNALLTIKTKSFQSLPRKGSRKSGAVFSQLLNKENLSFIDDPKKSLREKALDTQPVGRFVSELSRIYTDNLRPQQYYSEELIEIFIYEMYVRKRMLEVAEQIMNSTDPEAIGMQAGRDGIVRGYVNLITTLIRNQEKAKAFPSRQLKKLNNEVSKSIKENLRYLDPESKQILSAEIKKVTETSVSVSLKKTNEKLLKLLAD